MRVRIDVVDTDIRDVGISLGGKSHQFVVVLG